MRQISGYGYLQLATSKHYKMQQEGMNPKKHHAVPRLSLQHNTIIPHAPFANLGMLLVR